MFITTLLQRIFICLAMLTSMGTLVHDTRLNRALELASPANLSINLTSNLESMNDALNHNHIEKPSVSQVLGGIPRIQPRDDHRRYLYAKSLGRHSNFFGGSQILWPSV